MPNLSCGIPPSAGERPVVNDRHGAYLMRLAMNRERDEKQHGHTQTHSHHRHASSPTAQFSFHSLSHITHDRRRACCEAQSISDAVVSSGPKKSISGVVVDTGVDDAFAPAAAGAAPPPPPAAAAADPAAAAALAAADMAGGLSGATSTMLSQGMIRSSRLSMNFWKATLDLSCGSGGKEKESVGLCGVWECERENLF